MSSKLEWVEGIKGDLPLPVAVLNVMPEGTKVIAAEKYGTSAWTRTGKVTALSPDGEETRYFLKSLTGKTARALVEGEFHSASAMHAAAPGLVPEPVAWGQYSLDDADHFFYLGNFHDMDLTAPPDPAALGKRIAEFHSNGKSPNGMFGFPVSTTIGILERNVTWEQSWAKSFTLQLQDIIACDIETNGPWPELELALNQLIEAVIPRLLGALQSDGRDITPALVHGNLWEHNVGIDMETGEPIIFDLGCTYAPNEMEFGTWRCLWAYIFNSPVYLRMYQRHIEPSEPVDEWDDRNRLYSIWPYLVDSAGHPGSGSREILYNDVLYLCEKYAPFECSDKYDPEKDISVTGNHTMFHKDQIQ